MTVRSFHIDTSTSIACDCYPVRDHCEDHSGLLPVAVRLRLPNPPDDLIPSLSPVDLESGLGQLELIILPPLASILHLVLLFMTKLFTLVPDVC